MYLVTIACRNAHPTFIKPPCFCRICVRCLLPAKSNSLEEKTRFEILRKRWYPTFFFTAETHCYPVKSAYVPLLKPSSWSNPPFFPSNPHILGESQLPPRFRRCQVSAQALPPIRNDSIRAARHPWRQWWEAGFCLSPAISWKCGDMMGYNEQISSE